MGCECYPWRNPPACVVRCKIVRKRGPESGESMHGLTDLTRAKHPRSSGSSGSRLSHFPVAFKRISDMVAWRILATLLFIGSAAAHSAYPASCNGCASPIGRKPFSAKMLPVRCCRLLRLTRLRPRSRPSAGPHGTALPGNGGFTLTVGGPTTPGTTVPVTLSGTSAFKCVSTPVYERKR